MIPSSGNGWHVPAGTQFAVKLICIPTALVGALLTISFFWTIVGMPVLTFAIVSLHALTRASDVGAPHPAWPLAALAAIEAAFGGLGLVVFGSVAVPIALPIFACSVVTAVVSWAIVKTALPYPSPPPPTGRTWHQPSSPGS